MNNFEKNLKLIKQIKPHTYNYVGGFFMFKDNLFNKIEKKTNITKTGKISTVQRYKKIFTKFNFDNIRTSINNFMNVAMKNRVKITNVIIKNIL